MSTWPGVVDSAVTKVNFIDTIMAADHNDLDGKVRGLQAWIGDGVGELLGADGAGHGIGGMLSPVASGGIAFTFAARVEFASGKLFSFGEDYDSTYLERFYMDHAGLLNVSPVGGTNYEDLVTAGGDDSIPNKKFIADLIAAAAAACCYEEEQVVYVDKHGNDSDDGLSKGQSKLTIAAGLTAAIALSPLVSKPVVLKIGAGIFDEQVDLSTDYLSLQGVGTDLTIVRDDTNASYVLKLNNVKNIEIEGIHFLGITNNVDAIQAGTTAQTSNNITVRNSKFTSVGTGKNKLSSPTVSYTNLVADFHECVFTHSGNDGVDDPTATSVDNADLRLWNCTFEGKSDIDSALTELHACNFVGGTITNTAVLTHTGTTNDLTGLNSCTVKNTGAGLGVEVTQTTNVLQINGGKIDSTEASISGVTPATNYPVGISGVVMTTGMDANVYPRSGTGYVGSSGEMDFYDSLEDAANAMGENGGIVYLRRDETATGPIEVESSLIIDGNFRTLDIGSDAKLFSQSAAGASGVVLRNIVITDGFINWDQAQAGKLLLDSVRGGVRIDTTNHLSGKDITLNDCDLVAAGTNKAVVTLGHASTNLKVLSCSLTGNGTKPAIECTANNTAMDVRYSELTHGQGTGFPPIDGLTSPVTMISHLNDFESDPFDVNLSSTTPVKVNPGSNTAPALAAPNDLTSGVFFPAANNVGITADGEQALNVSQALVQVQNDVTNEVPALRIARQHASDTNDVGAVELYGKTSTDVAVPFANVVGNAALNTNGSHEGKLSLQVADAAVMADVYQVTSSQHTWRVNGADSLVLDTNGAFSSSLGASYAALVVADGVMTDKQYVDVASEKYISVRVLDEATDHTTGDKGGDFRLPVGWTVLDCGAYVDSAPTGAGTEIDIKEGGVSILDTDKIEIDDGDFHSEDAGTQPVIDDGAIAANAAVTFNIVAIAATPAKGLVVWMRVSHE